MSDQDVDGNKDTDLTSTPPSQYGSSSGEITSPSSLDSPERADVPPPQRSKTAPPLPPPASPGVESTPVLDGPSAERDTYRFVPPEPPAALRRTSSALSTGSSSGQSAREKKRLRFTPMANGTASSPEEAAYAMDYVDSHDLEDGLGRRRMKGKGVPRDQVDYLKSDPGTPNLSET